jgi:hypothetical protein
VHGIGTPVMGLGLRVLSPLCEIGISRRSVYQITTSREQARGEGNCARATNRGNEACECMDKGPWHMAKTIASGVGMTNVWLAEQGVLSLKTLWAKLAHLRGTATALLCVESTRPAPHARWCGDGARKRVSLPDLGTTCRQKWLYFFQK